MGLLDGDHQVDGLPGAVAHGRLLLLAVALVDAAGEQVGDQDVGGEVVLVAAELQDHVLAALKVAQDGLDGVLLGVRAHEIQAGQALEAPAQAPEGPRVDVHLFEQGAALLGGGVQF